MRMRRVERDAVTSKVLLVKLKVILIVLTSSVLAMTVVSGGSLSVSRWGPLLLLPLPFLLLPSHHLLVVLVTLTTSTTVLSLLPSHRLLLLLLAPVLLPLHLLPLLVRLKIKL